MDEMMEKLKEIQGKSQAVAPIVGEMLDETGKVKLAPNNAAWFLTLSCQYGRSLLYVSYLILRSFALQCRASALSAQAQARVTGEGLHEWPKNYAVIRRLQRNVGDFVALLVHSENKSVPFSLPFPAVAFMDVPSNALNGNPRATISSPTRIPCPARKRATRLKVPFAVFRIARSLRAS